MKIPKIGWSFIGISIVVLSCGIAAKVSKSSVSVEVDNKIFKSRISLQLQQATSLVQNATSTVQTVIDIVPFLGTETLNIEQMGSVTAVNKKEELELKKQELERVFGLLEEAHKGLQNIKF